MKRYVKIGTVILNVLLAMLFVWVLQQGCVRKRVSTDPLLEDKFTGQPFTIPLTVVTIITLPVK
jgi:hypothetical protein